MKTTLKCCCTLILVSCSVNAEQRILHDPFARPVLQKTADGSNNKNKLNSKSWSPILTSTLRAGNNSMVIVSGRVIKLDEEIDGYQLIKVDERSAVFIQNHQQIRLTLGGNE